MQNKSAAAIKKYAGIVTKIIKHLYGNAPAKVLPLTGGLTNFVYEVQRGNELLVVRISQKHSSLEGFQKEQWAVARAAEIKLPVPEILEVGQFEPSIVFMIVRKTAGKEAVKLEDRIKVVEEMGRCMARIHTIPTKGFGPVFDWSENILSKNNTWKEWLHEDYKIKERLAYLNKTRMINQARYKSVLAIIKEMEGIDISPCLHHGDMRLKNLLVNDDHKIVSIIDWENCISSIAPYWDLSISMHDLTVDEQLHFLNGYGITYKLFKEIAPFVKVFNLLNYAPVVKKLTDAGKREKIDQYRIRLSGLSDLFSI
jgi:hygromycin-B 4-O-kinase